MTHRNIPSSSYRQLISPTTRIRNLRQSGVPRRLVHRYMSGISRMWARNTAQRLDSADSRVTSFTVAPHEQVRVGWRKWKGRHELHPGGPTTDDTRKVAPPALPSITNAP